jgi:hypothetical protein
MEPDAKPSQPISPAKPTLPQVSALFTPEAVVPPRPPVIPPVQTYQAPQPAPKSYGTIMFLIGAFVVIIAVLIAAAAWRLGTYSAHSHNIERQGRQNVPPPPHIPTNGEGGTTGPTNSLAYPGATLGLSGSQEGKSFYQYKTNDPFPKVRDWYKERLPNAIISHPPGDRGLILNAGKTIVIISGQEGETLIMVSQEK